MDQVQQQPIQPNTPLSVTLQAQEWNQILAVLSEAPYKAVAPLIDQIGRQAQQQAQQQATMQQVEHALPNGGIPSSYPG